MKHSLPKGEMMHRDKPVDLSAIRRTALMTVEGENDDISGVGQTQAAQDLCVNLTDDRRRHYVQEKVGHYGVFNGSRFRAQIVPRIEEFAAAQEERARAERGIVTLRPKAEARVGTPAEERARVKAETAGEAEVEKQVRKAGALPV